jgi:sterol desaturase/sphingolipid hydroxylase (fatty acid hydroxylase superfamily)
MAILSKNKTPIFQSHKNSNKTIQRNYRLLEAGLKNQRFRWLLMTWIPLTIAFVSAFAGLKILTPLEILTCLILGLFGWTFFEYLLHRWIMHRGTWPKKIDAAVEKFLPHRTHHRKPEDPEIEIIEKPMKPLVVGSLLGLYFCLFAPWPYAFAFAFGGALGYIVYEIVHFATHKVASPQGALGFWHRQHMLHHYRDDTRNYGVTSPIWDLVFGTYFRPETSINADSD